MFGFQAEGKVHESVIKSRSDSGPGNDVGKKECECGVCQVGEYMQKFVGQGQDVGLDHMEWDSRLEKFITTDPAPGPVMTVPVEVLSQNHGHGWVKQPRQRRIA